MGIVKDNYVTSGASGNVGTLWSFRQRAGKTVLAKQRGASSKPPNEKGLALQARFKTSLTYARNAMKDPAIKAAYAAAAPRGVSAFNVALGDAASSPVVSLIDSTSLPWRCGRYARDRRNGQFQSNRRSRHHRQCRRSFD